MKTFWYWFILIFLSLSGTFFLYIAFTELNTRRSLALFFGIESIATFVYLLFLRKFDYEENKDDKKDN